MDVPVYQSKSSLISIQGLNDSKKEITIGTADFDLAKYVGKVHQTEELPLGGSFL